uniref:FYN-binding protein 2 n=1 Tax=Rhinolophus ferrumequinum TaxID=59479 RepID=A0A671DP05_RHIFE
MEAPPPRPVRTPCGGNALARGEGGAATQVGQVRSRFRCVPGRGKGRDCFLAGAGTTKRTLSPRIQLWEAGFASPAVPQRKVMDRERLRNFKELQAKFQKLDEPSLPEPTKFLAGVSQKGDIGSTQSARILANGKPLSSNHNQPSPYCPSGEFQPLKLQKMKLTQRSETQECSNSPGPPGRSIGSAVNTQKASLLLDMNQSNAEMTDKKKVVRTSSFRDKLRNWEKVSSQTSEMSPAFLLPNCGSRAFHLEEQKSLGLTLKEPRQKLDIKGAQTLPSQGHLMVQRKSHAASEDPTFLLSQHGAKSLEHTSPKRSPTARTCQPIYESELISHTPAAVEEGYLPPESADLEEPHNYEATISYLRNSGNSINLCTSKEIADSTYEVGIEELQKPWKSFLHQELSPKYEDKTTKEQEPCERKPRKTEKDLHSNHLSKVGAHERTPGKIQMMTAHGGRGGMLAREPGAVIDTSQTKAGPKDPKLARHFQRQCGYVEALAMTAEMPGPGAFKPSYSSEETYDDVEYPRREGPKSDFSNSFASDNEENSEEMYEDVYRTKSNCPKKDLEGKEAFKRLQRFFKKEKDRFQMKKTKSKENLSAFSISLPDLEFRSQEVIIHDDVNINEKESQDEDKVKPWKPKFLIPKGKQEKKGEESESLSPRNFFRNKKQNLEKKRMEREKLFRERFEYDKEITVINTAVACSSNSRNGIFDLPITPGEELDVIDITEENLLICRNSKGEYGYVLIDHLNFKHQGWSP